MGSGGTHARGKGFTFVEVNSVRRSGKLICCDFSSDGKLLASGGHDKEAVLWYADTLEPKATHEGHSMVITDVRFSPDLGFLATSSIDKTVRIWDIDNPGYSHHTFTGHSCGIASLDFHPKKDDLICSCDFGGEIRYWSISDGSCVGVFKGAKFQVRFQPCHGRFLAAAADNDNFLSIMDAEKQTCLYSMKGHREPISYLCWDPSGELLASLSEDSIRIWTFTPGNEGKCIHKLRSNGKRFYSCIFHPTHRSSLVIGCYQSLVIWDTIENRTKTLSAHGGIISSLAVSSVSGLVASTSHDKFVKLWK